MPKVLRTPDARFENLPDYPFAPHFVNVQDEKLGTMQLHYVDEGPRDGRVVIMMHGEPSWSYLYRKMITQVAASGCRVLAPDLIGFGRSDKPAETSDYSYNGHVDWMTQWLKAVDVTGAVLFCQDWGGLIGLRLVAEHTDRFDGVVAGNTFLPTGGGMPGEAFAKWKEFSQTVPEFPVGAIIRGATVKEFGEGVEEAYDAPYPDESYKAGARIFPALVPVGDVTGGVAENQKAWEVLSKFEKPFLTCFSDQDPVTGGLDKLFHKKIPGCQGQPHQTLEGGGHFLQEDLPDELSKIIIDFVAAL